MHERWIARCLTLAARGAGHVSPNPMVGAVLVGPDGAVLGEGWHEVYGGPHAEVNAVRNAREKHSPEVLREATLYVNLEPCSHHGKTPPCTDLILEHGIPRVVVGSEDPFPAVSGRGLQRLRDGGVEVLSGVLEAECHRFNEAFFHHVRTGRPLVTLKVAQTLDGQVATTSGDARWISGEASRRLVHQWRAELDGVLVGSGTARIDDPSLTVRHVEGRQPIRVVLDRGGTLPKGLKLFADAFATLAITAPGVRPEYADALEAKGGRILHAPESEGYLDLERVLDRLGREGGREGLPMQSLLVEAGPGLATALFRHDLVDRYFVFIAPKLAGEGIPALGALGVQRMAEAVTFRATAWEEVGGDLLFKGYRR
jgi:diaminohydroxyphosphoribosylaminopyrimidine deaminase / 5-amino-6-(5-phosphoribosylamino)uracil reductase